jgi:hypothetical protein
VSYNYTTKTGSLKSFLQRLKSKELVVPEKITQKYLESINLKTKHDRTIVRVLKSINFIDASGVPKQPFKDFRTDISKKVMTKELLSTYADLFKTFAKPYAKSRNELEDYFAKGATKVTKQTLGLYVDTFKTLCEFADFETELSQGEEKNDEAGKGKEPKGGQQTLGQLPQGLSMNMNIQITLPVTDDAKVYENIFKAIREQLFKKD